MSARTVASLSRLERKWLKARMCGFCEVGLLSRSCGGYSGPHVLPVIEGVRDKEETVDLGPPCDMDAKRGAALESYKPRPARQRLLNRPEAPRDPGASSFPGTHVQAGAGGVVNSVHGLGE